jgi:hypothetical protein
MELVLDGVLLDGTFDEYRCAHTAKVGVGVMENMLIVLPGGGGDGRGGGRGHIVALLEVCCVLV